MAWHSEVATADPDAFEAEIDVAVFRHLSVTRSRLSPSILHRSSAIIERLSTGTWLYFVEQGSITLRQGTTRVAVGPGSAAIVSGYEPHDLATKDGARLIILVLSRGALDTSGVGDYRHPPRRLAPSTTIELAVALLSTLSSHFPLPESVDGKATQAALLALAMGIIVETEPTTITPKTSRVTALHVVRAIERRSRENDLTVDGVAADLMISRRQLQRLLTDSASGSFIELVRRHRVHDAVALFGAAAWRDRSLDEISHAAGFLDTTRMRRAFLLERGITPSEYRRSLPPPQDTALTRS